MSIMGNNSIESLNYVHVYRKTLKIVQENI